MAKYTLLRFSLLFAKRIIKSYTELLIYDKIKLEVAMDNNYPNDVVFILDGITFEYDRYKNELNIEKHGISFENAARVFLDYDRIEYYDEENSINEDRYDVIGSTTLEPYEVIGKAGDLDGIVDVLFVVYTERIKRNIDGSDTDVIRIISARAATSFEKGVYYGKN